MGRQHSDRMGIRDRQFCVVDWYRARRHFDFGDSAIGFAFSPQQFFRSYLFAYLFWMSVGLGCLPILMIYHLVGGAWGYSIRRLLESGTRTIVLLSVLFIPVLVGMREIYRWVNPSTADVGEAVLKQTLYLNVPFFIARAVFFFF